mmetsp:Transcript_31625/g.97753  ORF Transcript_31625/g.97753 Transcript_31625/m.97753 type:complete len:208 (-) Transcript_31625:1359-1982(-)
MCNCLRLVSALFFPEIETTCFVSMFLCRTSSLSASSACFCAYCASVIRRDMFLLVCCRELSRRRFSSSSSAVMCRALTLTAHTFMSVVALRSLRLSHSAFSTRCLCDAVRKQVVVRAVNASIEVSKNSSTSSSSSSSSSLSVFPVLVCSVDEASLASNDWQCVSRGCNISLSCLASFPAIAGVIKRRFSMITDCNCRLPVATAFILR